MKNYYEREKVGQDVAHDLRLNNRKELEINGVKDIDSFDNEEFLIQTVMGYLIIRGRQLQLKNLNVAEGLIQINGTIAELTYVDEHHQEKAKGLFSKLFK